MDKLDNHKQKRALFIVLAAICPVVIMSLCLCIRNMLPGQKELLVYGDYFNEFPIVIHFWDSFLHGKSIEYSFSLGMGSPMMPLYSLFVFSPFSIIQYLINDVTMAAYIMLMLKVSFASLAMFFFLIRDIKCRRENALLFSLFYSLSSYVLIYFDFIHTMDKLYILPLIIHFLIEYVKNDKKTGLVLIYAFSFINNFFAGYMCGFYSFVVYIALLLHFKIRGKELRKSIFNYFFIVFVAALLSGPVIFPAIMYLLQHMSAGSDFSAIPLRSPLYIINSLLLGRKIHTIFDSMPALYCGWPCILLTIVFFLDKRNKGRKLIAAIPVVFLLICSFWHPAYLFLHLFNEPDSFPWRFSFLLIFSFVCIAAYEYENLNREFDRIPCVISDFLIVFATAIGYLVSRGELVEKDLIPGYILLINIGFVILYTIFENRKILFFALACAELFTAGCLQLPQTEHRTVFQEDLKRNLENSYTFAQNIENNDHSFFRTGIASDFTFNESLIGDYPGMDYFCSFGNNTLINALSYLGFMGRPQQYSYTGNTEFTNMIFSVANAGSVTDHTFFANSPVLPLAFATTEDMKNIKVSENPFENQQALADAMTYENRKLYLPIQVEMGTNQGVELICDQNSAEYVFRKTQDEGMGFWCVKEPITQPAYLYISTGIRGSGVFDKERILGGAPIAYETGVSIPVLYEFFRMQEDDYPMVLLNMKGDVGAEIRIKETYANRLDMDAVQSLYEELSPLGLEIDRFSDEKITGSVVADDEHTVLFSSIPYDVNWHIYIDGKECETFPVFNGAFLACDITPGSHEVEFRFKDSSLTAGLGMALIGLLLLILIAAKDKGKGIKMAEGYEGQEKKESEISIEELSSDYMSVQGEAENEE